MAATDIGHSEAAAVLFLGQIDNARSLFELSGKVYTYLKPRALLASKGWQTMTVGNWN